MSCFHPLKAYGRFDDVIKKYDLIFTHDHFLPYLDRDGHLYTEKMLIPCGQCIGCRLDYSRDWAVRCVLEAKQYHINLFLTLTYDDDHLPVSDNYRINKETGETESFLSNPLVPDHLTKFMKDLREYCRTHYNHTGIRFFACGEYGSQTQRPHFHIILFNAPDLPDLKLYKTNYNGDQLFNSQVIDRLWKKGYSVIGEVNFSTCAYVARYMLKKHKGNDRSYYSENGLVPEFTRCSRMPGIAKSYFDKKSGEIYEYDKIIITDSKGKAKRCKPPAYFDRLYDHNDHESFIELKKNRKNVAEVAASSVLSRTSLSHDEYLLLKEGNKKAAIKKLIRELN